MRQKLFITALLITSFHLGITQPKPSFRKAEKALKEKKLAQAKEIIDITTQSEEYMFKKGQPSKNAARSWYTKALIYASIDTSTHEPTRALATDPFADAKEAFEKFKQLDQGKTDYYLIDDVGLPILISEQYRQFAQAFANISYAYYQKQEDDDEKRKQNQKKAFANIEKSVFFLPDDTVLLMNAGIYMGPQAEEYEKSAAYIKRFQKAGGQHPDAYIQLYSIYRDKLKDNEKALEVAHEMVKKYPDNAEYSTYLLDIYVKMKRMPEALDLMKKQIEANPKDKKSMYYAGLICFEMGDISSCKSYYTQAIAVDSEYYEPTVGLAQMSYDEVKKLREQRNDITGSDPSDLKKRSELYRRIKTELENCLSYYVKLEKLKPNEDTILYGLLTLYGDLNSYDENKYDSQVKRLKAKMKMLGIEVD